MLSSKELRTIAKSTIKNLRIGRKPNPGVERARKKYGKFIEQNFENERIHKKTTK